MAIGGAIGAAVIGAYASSRASDRAADSLSSSEAQALAYQREAAERAANTAIPLFAQAQDNANLGFQGALDVFGNTIPQQLTAFQQGNQQAQSLLGAGLEQSQNAILGNPISNKAFQTPTQIDPIDMSVFQQQLPDFGRIGELLGSDPVMGPINPNPNNNPDFMSGAGNVGGSFNQMQTDAVPTVGQSGVGGLGGSTQGFLAGNNSGMRSGTTNVTSMGGFAGDPSGNSPTSVRGLGFDDILSLFRNRNQGQS